MEQKYVVFKLQDWVDFKVRILRGDSVDLEPIQDCFVIRFQDVLAGPGLHAYANAAQNMIDGVSLHELDLHGFVGTEPEAKTLRRALERVRDAAFEAANIADQYPNKKVPD